MGSGSSLRRWLQTGRRTSPQTNTHNDLRALRRTYLPTAAWTGILAPALERRPKRERHATALLPNLDDRPRSTVIAAIEAQRTTRLHRGNPVVGSVNSSIYRTTDKITESGAIVRSRTRMKAVRRVRVKRRREGKRSRRRASFANGAICPAKRQGHVSDGEFAALTKVGDNSL